MSLKKKEQKLLFAGFAPSDQDRIRNITKKQRLIFSSFAEIQAGRLTEIHEITAVFVKHAAGKEDSLAFARKLRDEGVAVPVILITAPGDETTVQNALEHGVDECLAADGNHFDALSMALDRALARRQCWRAASDLSSAVIASKHEWVTIIDAITDLIFITDNKCRLVKMNQAFASFFNAHPKDLIGSKCIDLFRSENPCRSCSAHTAKQQGAPDTTESTIGGELYQVSTFPLHVDARPLIIHVMKNITETKKLKDLLYYSDKLAALGLLVGGVAHEINNPLTGIIGYAELLRMKPEAGNIDEELKKILEGAERCRKIVQNLLTFSRQKAPTKSIEAINNLIDRTIDLRTYWLRTNDIAIVKEYGEPSTVLVDAQQIQLVILNVLVNAEQAISETGRGNGRITFNTKFDPDAHTVTIRVSDNGFGIPKEKQAKVFDPFFTTKPLGLGTGLGLSIAHGIATEHGGRMWVESVEGQGTTMAIELPTGVRHLKA